MKRLSLLFVFLLLCATTGAQETTLKKIEKRVSTLSAFKTPVIFSTQGERGGKTEYKGEMLVKGKSYAIKFGQMEIYSDGQNIWTYTPSRSEVVIEKTPVNSGLMSSPTSFLAVSEKDFTSVGSGTKVIGTSTCNTVTLKPKGEMAKSIREVFVVYDGSYMPKEIVATTTEGLKVSVVIQQITALPSIADTELRFDMKRAKEVIDFR